MLTVVSKVGPAMQPKGVTTMSTPTTSGDAATGVLASSEDGQIVLALPGTDYRLHLQLAGPIDAPSGKPITGRITAKARRVDVVHRGGRFIEPLYGRPRRLQGTVVATDPHENTITVKCGGGCPFVCRLMAGQRAINFDVGAFVGFDVEAGAGFEPGTAVAT
jgi:hypothetical protein